MKQIIFISFFLIARLTSYGQTEVDSIKNESLIKQYYQYYIKYPRQAQILKIEGTIILTFDVDSTCLFINRKQDIKLGHGCGDIAWKTLDKMEKDFKKNNTNKCPHMKNTMNIPVVFKLR